MRLSVILAAFNEEKNLPEVIPGIKKVLPDVYQLIVVDDGSTDKTSEVAKELGAEVVSQPHRMGKGKALRNGISIAGGEILVFLDADGQDPPEEIPKLLSPILEGKADFVNGSKFIGKCKEGLSLP